MEEVEAPHVPAETPPVAPRPPFPAFWQGIVIVILTYLLANLVVAAILFPQMFQDLSRHGEVVRSFDVPGVSIFANSLTFALAILVTLRLSGMKARDGLPFRKVGLMSLATIALLLGGGMILADLVANLLVVIWPPPDFVTELFGNLLGQDAPLIRSFIFLVIVAPITEEFFFRGVLQQAFRRRYSARKSILYSSILFALIHVLPWQMIPAFLLGLLFGWWVEATGSLWPSILAHAVTNGTTFVLSRLHPDLEPFKPVWPSPITLAAAVCALALGGLLARRYLSPAPAPAPYLTERSPS